MAKRINLGDRVKDTITGMIGIAVAHTLWLNGCERITVQAETLDKDGKVPPAETFDDAQLEVIVAGVKAIKRYNDPRPIGGPDRHEDPEIWEQSPLRRLDPGR